MGRRRRAKRGKEESREGKRKGGDGYPYIFHTVVAIFQLSCCCSIRLIQSLSVAPKKDEKAVIKKKKNKRKIIKNENEWTWIVPLCSTGPSRPITSALETAPLLTIMRK